MPLRDRVVWRCPLQRLNLARAGSILTGLADARQGPSLLALASSRSQEEPEHCSVSGRGSMKAGPLRSAC